MDFVGPIPPPLVGITLPMTELAGETTTKKNVEEIWRHLMGNEIKKIGVCGMGGVGKTTIVTHLNNRLTEEMKFHHVIWVTVPHPLDLIKVQDEIVNALGESFLGVNNRTRRADMLLRMFEGKRFVLILDDVWDAIQLEELGIPEPNEENGCKLVITTRSSNVCCSMGCEAVKVKPLSEKEALELFLEKAELDISKVPTLKEIVELVAKQCAGLPLAIVRIASRLKGEEDIREWNTALHESSNNASSIKVDDKVFVRLKFSYDRLENERIQRCFLYCALYPKDHNIRKNELVDCWIAEGLVDEMVNLKATEDRAHSIIKILVSNFLLLEGVDRQGRRCVKLHDVVRDMALKHITSVSPLFMVKADMKLEEFPSGKEWKENLDKVSLMKNLVKEIPSNMSPNCQILSTLLLQDNPLLESIQESFFFHMYGLKILNLSRTRIESLPNSVCGLTNLTALLLQNCWRLKRVPSLAGLGALEKLELGYTAINEVPAGMEMLTNLTSLDLLCSELHMIPAGIFSKLCRLKKLVVNWGLETLKVAVEEAATLKKLDRLLAQFRNLQDFNYYAESLNSQRGPEEYCLLLSPKFIHDSDQLDLSYWRIMGDVNKVVIMEGCNICGREEDSIVLPKEVEVLFIKNCDDVRNMSNIPTFNTLERLEILVLYGLSNLSGILLDVSESSSAGPYSHLKSVRIYVCQKLEKLISSKLLSELKNLERIDVWSCTEMEELIAVDDDDDNEERSPKEFLLPKLKKLVLIRLPKLKSICSCNGLVMVCDSLQVINAWCCPKLKKILSSSSKLQLGVLKNLEEIDVGDCGEMEEIIAIDDVECKKELIFSDLPKLKNLTLRNMPELKSIINVCGSNGVMVCDSLREVSIFDCPKLKRLPIYLPVNEKGEPSKPPALIKITVSREWWEALEWDHLHPRAKTLLLPFCQFPN